MEHEQEQQLETIEIDIVQAKENISKMESLKKLINNKDFINLVQVGYFEKEPSRLALLKADPSQDSDASQAKIIKQIDSIGLLRQYFLSIMHMGRMSQRAIVDDEKTREELLSETA